MSITDELRHYISDRAGQGISLACEEAIANIADCIDAEHEQAVGFCKRLEDAAANHEDVEIFGVEYTALPLGADGVPIRVGDKVLDWDTPRLVAAVSKDSICLAGYESDSYYRMGVAKNYHHYHKPTVKDVLREFVSEFSRDDTELCDEEIIERFAVKLRLADDRKEQ